MDPTSYKENTVAPALNYAPRVKPEPVDHLIAPLGASTTLQAQALLACQRVVKAEARQPLVSSGPSALSTNLLGAFARENRPEAPVLPPAPLYNIYGSVHEIAYTPENALRQGLGMVKTIKNDIKKLELGSKMRKEVWLREVAGLESQGAPTTLIAVCGATGAGKSSLLNAILDDNIVPTSGMRACTAVVTEIAYHDKPTIDADVSFLSLAEWKEELEVLLDDLLDEDGNIRRATDLRSEAGVAWHKVHAVYPSIDQDQLARMTVDQIIACDPTVAARLGTTKHICSKNSKAFATEISKYIDSKDQKRDQKGKKGKDGKKKDKKKDKHDKKKDSKQADNAPALWPLIRQVVVKFKSTALSTGAILVDLPGVADANAARSNICKDYMKKCDCIWVLAPITRAVDDRTAKDLLGDAFKIQLKMDGNYDDSAITFIATKADDISCSEVIRALKLEDDEDIEAVEEKIAIIKEDQKRWKSDKAAADRAVKATEKELKEIRAIGSEYRAHLKALEDGEPFEPKLTAKSGVTRKSPSLGKRKRTGSGNKASPKRRKSFSDEDSNDSDEDDDDDDDIEDTSDDNDSDSDSDSSQSDSEDEDKDYSGSDSDSDSDDEQEEDKNEMDVEEEATEESLKAKIEETRETINTLRVRLSSEKAGKKKAADEIVNAKDRLAKAQTEKNGLCSLKRSDFSREVLKQDFRTGLREIDEADIQERDPDNFDPTQQIRNYDDIDLPTFCASARDYIRITKQVKGDGKPTCFTDVANTGIPALQEWCQTLTVSSRQRSARTFLTHLQSFIASVRSYVQGITEVKEEDRKALREQWETQMEEDDEDENEVDEIFDPFSWLRHDAWNEAEDGTFLAKKKTPKVNMLGEPIGITPLLTAQLEQIVDVAVSELKNGFEDGLNDKLQTGAENAAATALETSDQFAASMHWQTYRATLRRHGSFRRCLNTELINPLTRNIASSWGRVFEADLFASFESQAMAHIKKLLKDVENSATPSLQDRSKRQGEIALEEAKIAMKSLVTVVRDILNEQQKEVSRCLVPHVQTQLRSGYNQAAEERGRGSVARQKAVLHDFVKTTRNHVFNGGADALIDRLSKAADTVGEALDAALGDLSKKIEVSMSVLWESPREDPRQMRARRETLETLQTVTGQVSLWSAAEKNARNANS
ncbi:hypothetical protein K439DRAFT_1628171 [Ramaria rubella]|nr:hypothetical protein K439DRAFT_1628171 [Ramaria rubella]